MPLFVKGVRLEETADYLRMLRKAWEEKLGGLLGVRITQGFGKEWTGGM